MIRLKELYGIVVDMVSIYDLVDGEYKEVFYGDIKYIPDSLKDKIVETMIIRMKHLEIAVAEAGDE